MKLFSKLKNKKLILILLAFLSTLVFCVNLKVIDPTTLEGNTRIIKFLEKCVSSLNGNNIIYIPTFLFFYYFYSKHYFDGNKLNKTAVILAIFFALAMLFGYSYHTYNSWELIFSSKFQFFKCLIVGIGYYTIFYLLIKKLYLWFDNYKPKKGHQNKILNFIFEKHPFVLPFIIILIFWLPYIIAFYPGTTTGGDTRIIIYNFYHIENSSTESINLISEDQYINQHHSVLHTVIVGGFMKIGELLGDYNIGMFMYTIIQVLVCCSILSYSLLWMKKRNIPLWIRVLALCLYSLLSFFPLFAINCGKDTYSAIFTVLYILLLIDLTIDREMLKSKKFILILILTMLLIMLFRNDGIYRIVIPFIIIIFINKVNWKKLCIVLAIPLVIFIGYTNILLPTLSITKGSVREMLSVPFQQTARVVYIHGKDAFSEEEIEIISNILSYDTLAEDYDPSISDPVKNKFNKNASTDDLIAYFKVWFKNFFKYPTDYIQATLNNTYQYFYPNVNKNIGYTTISDLCDDGIFNICFNDSTEDLRNTLDKTHRTLKKLPVISMLYSVGFHVDFLLIAIGYMIYSKKKKYIGILSPLAIILLVSLVSPVNGHWRYTLPIIMSFPITIATMYLACKDKETKKL